jgi:arabinose-5-phosphate isomerase
MTAGGKLDDRRSPTESAAVTTARRVIAIEIDALRSLAERLDTPFERAVEAVLTCKGRVIITGMGKSGQICRKIAATLASTGTSSFFVHAAEAAHGDLGMLARGDVCIAISNSGKTRELVSLLPSIKRLRIPVIAVTGGLGSPLAEAADIVLDVSVAEEACPLGLAPTASTTATLALGDALAVAVLERRGFSEDDFALLHPGGALGAKLLRVSDVMHPTAEVPKVGLGRTVRQALDLMSKGRLGVVGVIDDEGRLAGVITDGDVRRGILQHDGFVAMRASDAMTVNPKTIAASALAAEALGVMEEHSITSLFIVDPETRKPTGVVHMHDLLRAGIA